AEAWYGRPAARLDLVGVTGTNGKTTSVTLLRHVLAALEPTGSIGTLGAFDPDGATVVSEAGNLTTPGPIDLQATLAALVERGGEGTARRVTLDAQGARFELGTPMGGAAVRLPLLGRFNVANALGVAACTWGLGVPVETVAERLTAAPQIPGRMERIAARPCTVLRDYAHTPDALERALETLRPLTAGRLIVVFGAGGDRDPGKRAPMGEVCARLADIAIATSDNPRTED